MQKPLVSIVTIVFNGEAFIEQAIQSVLNQSHQNIEYILIDGGSKDNTVEIIKKYESKIAFWVSEPDNGIADAFNKGLKHCTGEIIGILNADDWYETETVEQIVKAFEKPEIGIVHGKLQNWMEGEKSFIYESNHHLIKKDMTICHPTVFVRKSVYDSVGHFHDYRYAMDYDFLLRANLAGVKFHFVDKILTNMRMEGVSNVQWKKALKDVRDIKNSLLGKKIQHEIYFRFQIFKKSTGQFLDKIGLGKLANIYRTYFSLVQKSMN